MTLSTIEKIVIRRMREAAKQGDDDTIDMLQSILEEHDQLEVEADKQRRAAALVAKADAS